MKKLIILSGMLCLLASTSANADSFSLTIGEPQPAYVEAPVYVAPAPIYPTYVVEGERYHGWRRGHEHHDNGNHGRGNRGRGHDDRDHK